MTRWLCKKMSYYPNVLFSIIWHFDLECCAIEAFQDIFQAYSNVKCHFVYTMKIQKYAIFYLNNVLTMSQYGVKQKYSFIMMSSPYHTMKVRICCLLMMFAYVGN